MLFQNIKNWGAVGDGITDDTAALQAALDSGAGTLYIPTGLYRVTTTLRIRSNTQLHAEATARIFLSGERKHRGDFLLTNANHEAGDSNIEICGGVWDGGNRLPENAKPDIFDENRLFRNCAALFQHQGADSKAAGGGQFRHLQHPHG